MWSWFKIVMIILNLITALSTLGIVILVSIKHFKDKSKKPERKNK